jgi:hypothetical protein
MLYAARNDEELALANRDDVVAELHGERALEDHEELVLCLVAVPDEGPLELDDFDVLAVELADDLRVPVRGESGEAVLQIDDVHGGTSMGYGRWGTRGRRRRCLTAAVTEPAPKNYDFKTRVIGGSHSPLCYAVIQVRRQSRRRPIRSHRTAPGMA